MFAINKNDNAEHPDSSCCPAHDAGRKVREVIDHATHNARDTLTETEKHIREHPVKASVIAAGVGFLLGTLFRRR